MPYFSKRRGELLHVGLSANAFVWPSRLESSRALVAPKSCRTRKTDPAVRLHTEIVGLTMPWTTPSCAQRE